MRFTNNTRRGNTQNNRNVRACEVIPDSAFTKGKLSFFTNGSKNLLDQAQSDVHKPRHGFTLIELLVVVFIIGILAAVALPQYQKAIEKAKTAQALTLLKSVYQAAKVYELANGSWPSSFSQLDVKIPWTGNTKVTTPAHWETFSNGDWSLVLSYSTSVPAIWVIRNSGNYAYAGFCILKFPQEAVPANQLLCVEGHSANSFSKSFTAKHKTGDYCKKIMKGTEIKTNHASKYFTL